MPNDKNPPDDFEIEVKVEVDALQIDPQASVTDKPDDTERDTSVGGLPPSAHKPKPKKPKSSKK